MRFDMTPSEIARHDARLITNPDAVLNEAVQRAYQLTEWLRQQAARNSDMIALNNVAARVTLDIHGTVDLLRLVLELRRIRGGESDA